jgi:hypothetical protein
MLALTMVSELSTLEEEFERERLDVWLVLILAFTILSELSTLEDDVDRRTLEV